MPTDLDELIRMTRSYEELRDWLREKILAALTVEELEKLLAEKGGRKPRGLLVACCRCKGCGDKPIRCQCGKTWCSRDCAHRDGYTIFAVGGGAVECVCKHCRPVEGDV